MSTVSALRTTVPALTRRRFLAATAAAGATVAGATLLPWSELLGAAGELDPDTGVLVVVTLYGGNDGLGTVVPAADPAYQDARPELAYRPEELLDLGPDADGLGLSPALPGLHRTWQAGRLAVVRGVGYPEPDHSHFRSMAIWQTASPRSPNGAGWLGRWLDAVPDDPMRAVSVETVLPPFLVGERAAASTLSREGLELPGGRVGRAVRGLAEPDPTDDRWRSRAATSVAHLQRIESDAGAILDRSAIGGDEFGKQLSTVATLVEARVPTRVYSVSLGGFDTHADERKTQERLLGKVDAALSAFTDRMARTEAGRQVVTLVYSEFGRRVAANGSDGTDHGTAGPVFVLGDAVRGGLLGEQPSLTALEAGDLTATVDFRDVYTTLAERVLGVDGDLAVPGHQGRLDEVFSTGLL